MLLIKYFFLLIFWLTNNRLYLLFDLSQLGVSIVLAVLSKAHIFILAFFLAALALQTMQFPAD